MNLNKWLDNNPGMYFYAGFILGPTGLIILDIIFGNDKSDK